MEEDSLGEQKGSLYLLENWENSWESLQVYNGFPDEVEASKWQRRDVSARLCLIVYLEAAPGQVHASSSSILPGH